MPAPSFIASRLLPAPFSGAWAVAGVWMLVGLFCGTSAVAADGRFEVINAGARIADNNWLVDARIDLELSEEALQVLQNGIALHIAFQYQVTSRRRFWPDKLIETRQQNFEVQYLSLTQRYVVRNVNEQSVSSYATLFSALRYLGQVRDFEILGVTPDSVSQRYEFAMRAVLDWEKLPGPLAMLAFWRGDFSLESDWYRWTPKE